METLSNALPASLEQWVAFAINAVVTLLALWKRRPRTDKGEQ